MKSLVAIAALFLLSFTIHWENDFNKAKELALTEHKYILLNFSGSDWCGPCIRMKHEILENETFTSFADDKLVLVNADFPRQKKNQLAKAQQQQNEKLADQYNKNGNFPYTLLLDPSGKIIKAWDGFPEKGAASFTQEISHYLNGGK